MTLGAEFNVESLIVWVWNTISKIPKVCVRTARGEKVEVYLLNSSFEKLHLQVQDVKELPM